MLFYKTHYLLLSSLLLFGCSSAYQDLVPAKGTSDCLQKFKPTFQADWYNASVDVIGKHISGLLLIKTMPDSSKRVVFTNEVGISFFDFEFLTDGSFKVHQVINQLNKKAVITLLRKDFELIMMQNIKDGKMKIFTRNNEIFYAVQGKKETDYFITDKDCASLLRIEKASKRKKKTEVTLFDGKGNSPDSVYLQHFTFNMQIALKKLKR